MSLKLVSQTGMGPLGSARLSALFALLWMCVAGVCAAEVVSIPDENLAQAIRVQLGIQEQRPITAEDMEKMGHFFAVSPNIVDLTGLEYAVNLWSIQIYGNRVKNLAPLRNLKKLISLEFTQSEIEDLSPLKNLTELVYVNLSDNRIEDLSPLSGATNISVLHASRNRIKSIEALRGKTNLGYLNLEDNKISDLSPMAGLERVEMLRVANNQIANIEAIRTFRLKTLDLSSNQVVDLSPIEGMLDLETLQADGNRIVSLRPLSALTALTALSLNGNEIEDLGPIASLTKLSALNIHDNRIRNLDPLREIVSLASLNAGNNQIESLEPLRNLTNLSVLGLQRNRIGSLDPVKNLSRLVGLDVSENQIVDLSPLEFLPLTHLGAGGNQISDLEPLRYCGNLRLLDLHNNQVTRIEALHDIWFLQSLDLSGNQIENPEILGQISSIEFLYLANTGLVDFSFLIPDSGSSDGLIWPVKPRILDLDLSDNRIADISPLNAMRSPDRLRLDRNPITDFSPLAEMGAEELGLSGLGIRNLDFVTDWRRIVHVDLSDNEISDLDSLRVLAWPGPWGTKVYSVSSLDLSNNPLNSLEPLLALPDLRALTLSRSPSVDLGSLVGLPLTRLELCEMPIGDFSFLNGLPNLLELLLFEQDPISYPLADEDGDGASNLLEYFADTDPRDDQDAFQLYLEPAAVGPLMLVYSSTRAGVRFVPEFSKNLWEWHPVASTPSTDGRVQWVTDNAAPSKRFYRVRAEVGM